MKNKTERQKQDAGNILAALQTQVLQACLHGAGISLPQFFAAWKQMVPETSLTLSNLYGEMPVLMPVTARGNTSDIAQEAYLGLRESPD